jgi:hypothetical protein
VKVYVAGLYLAQKSSDPNAIIKSDSPKRIAMQFGHGHAHFTGLNAENSSLPLADLRDR